MHDGQGVRIDGHYDKAVAFRAAGCQCLSVQRREECVARTDEFTEVLADGIVLHLVVSLFREVALHQTPLVVALLHVLPVHPRHRHNVTYVVHQFLCQVQVSGNTASAAAYFAHP